MFIAPSDGYSMTSWSLESYVPRATTCPGKFIERGCYFVFYSRGFGEGNFTFWVELQVGIIICSFHSPAKIVHASFLHLYTVNTNNSQQMIDVKTFAALNSFTLVLYKKVFVCTHTDD